MKRILIDLGFEEIAIVTKGESEELIRLWNVADGAEKVVFSAYIQAVKA